MDAWELWRTMAQEASETAQMAEAAGHLRSAASRYYYAAYQAVTALLLYRGLITPVAREAWSHSQTPILLYEDTEALIVPRDRRRDLAIRLLTRLYELRVAADYTAGHISASQIAIASRMRASF